MSLQQESRQKSYWQRLVMHFRESFATEAFIGTPTGRQESVDELVHKRRRDAYRYILLVLCAVLAPIVLHDFYSQQLVGAVAGAILLLVFVANIWQLSLGHTAFLRPTLALFLTIALVFLSAIYGHAYNFFWLYPLLVALPVMLRTRVAMVMGVGSVIFAVALVFQAFEFTTAVVISASMAHTLLASTWLMFAVSVQARHLRDMAITDHLTGAFNRRYLQAQASHTLEIWQRYERPSSLLLIDVDHFKRVNDKFGHAEGDAALKRVVELIAKRIRAIDTLCRYGGEEFVVLLTEADAESAVKVGNEIRAIIEADAIIPEGGMTVSVGVCDVKEVESVDHWLNLADAALYLAKTRGRNRVEVATAELISNNFGKRKLPDWR